MKVIPIQYKIQCEVGGCGRGAKYRVQTEDTGVHTGIHLCERCAKAAYAALKEEFYKGKKA